MRLRTILSALALAAAPAALLAQAAPPAAAPAGPPVADPAWKVPEVIAFMGLKPGDRVADVVGGRLSYFLAKAVGPTGHLYALETAEIVKRKPNVLDQMGALSKAMPWVTVTGDPVMSPLPANLDVVFIRQNYHDLYDPFMGPADVPAFNKNVFKALKKGGKFVILDHAAPAGTGIGSTNTTHRIDPERVKADMKAAGFVFDGESKILANPADDGTKGVFDPSLRGHTNQFLMRFRKP